jgi:hypothetical protein
MSRRLRQKMPIVVAQQVEKLFVYTNFFTVARQYLFLINVTEIANKYRHVCNNETRVHAFLSRVFNGEYEAINEPRIFAH